MNYFQTLPTITQTDFNGNNITVTNLITRAYFLPSLLSNILLFYSYDVKEGDTPENIAYKYYNDVYSYWVLLYSNNIIDPYSSWPLTSSQFDLYLLDKYRNDTANALSIPANTVTTQLVMSYTLSTVDHYEQIITTFDSNSTEKQVIKVIIDEDTYNNMIEQTHTNTFGNGVTATKIISKNAVSIYNNELDINESKRNINIMNNKYLPSVTTQFNNLMS
jgi:hypothetical protein